MAKPIVANYSAHAVSDLARTKTVVKSVNLTLPKAHPLQYELITALDRDPRRRFIVGACGTKFGKTFGSTAAIVKYAWNNADKLAWWISPVYKQAQMAYTMVTRLLPKGTFAEHKADMYIELLKPDSSVHSVIEFKSAENPDTLRGFGVHFFVMDEAARCKYESFVSLMTTITHTNGRGFLISTPKGRGWFYDIYQKGLKADNEGNPLFDEGEDPNPAWYSMRMPTWANPHVQAQAIEDLRSTMPEDVFQQEVSAEFLLDSAGVFRGVGDCIKGTPQKPLPGHRYVMGVDLARIHDFSVITVMDAANKHLVHFDRFNKLSWEVQYSKIVETAKRYNNASVYMDSTGIGDPICETISRAGVRVKPFKISAQSKQHLIDSLRVNIERGLVSFPNYPIMIRELQAFEYEVAASGLFKYSAPSGFHDDCVISLALANQGLEEAPWVYRYKNIRGV